VAAAVGQWALTPEDEGDQIIVSKKGLAELKRRAEEQTRENERLRKEIAELRRRLQVHENPNVPPSVRNHSPGFARDRPLTPPEKRQHPGGRPGHRGTTRTPLPTDEVVPLTIDACTNCQGRRLRPRGTETEQEVEVTHHRKVTDYLVQVSECLDCGATVRARLPSGRAPSGYGPELQAEIVMGKIAERLPYRKLVERLARYGVPSCPATLQGVVWGASERLGTAYDAILERIRAAGVVYADETSFHVDGERWWLWSFSTPREMLFVVRPSRGEEVVREVLGEGFRGKVIVCDGHGAYPHAELGWVLQRCWSHLLRVAKAGAEEGPTAAELYEALAELYERTTRELETASPRARAGREAMGERVMSGLSARFGESWGRGVGKVMTYVENGRPWWLTFLRHPGVEPTNNRAERSIREAVVVRKIVGTLRNTKGAEAFAHLLTVLGTWKLRGEDPSRNLYAALT
jgi:transposase